MATLTTKFDVGDVVYYPSTERVSRRMECPDCQGTKRWQAISPAGRGYTFPCPRCSTNYMNNRALSLEAFVAEPRVNTLTIRDIGWDSGWHDEAPGPVYKSWPPGGGGGTSLRETQVYATQEEAMEVARVMAAEQTTHIAESPNYYNEHLTVCDYQLDIAAIKAAENKLSRTQYDLSYFVEDLVELATDASEGFRDLTPLRLIEVIEKRFPKALPDDLERHEATGKVSIKECVC